MSTVAEQFKAAMDSHGFAQTSAELLPTGLAKACREVLPADGAGLGAISARFRVPLGASGEDAAAAELLQFTVGEGPCLQALYDNTELRVSADDIERRWPAFYDELARRTPFRSIVSVPVQITPTIPGALDLYFLDPQAAFGLEMGAAVAVAEEVAVALRAAGRATEPSMEQPDVLLPSWMYSPSARARVRTWIATGVLMGHFHLTAIDAFARLRAHAYAREQDLTAVTDSIIDGSLPPDDLNA